MVRLLLQLQLLSGPTVNHIDNRAQLCTFVFVLRFIRHFSFALLLPFLLDPSFYAESCILLLHSF